MKTVYLGSGEFGIECLEALAQSGHSPALIVTQPARPAGRDRKPRPTPAGLWAKNRSIDLLETENVNSPEVIARIAALRPELIVVIAFGQKIGRELIGLPGKGAINVHASLLPLYRGAAPVNLAIINGETKTGISIISLAEEIDAGDILAQVQTDIGKDETAGQLHDRLALLAAPLLLETLDKIADGSVVHIRQDNSQATMAPKLKKSDALLDFREPADLLERKIRGFWPWPGAAAYYLRKDSTQKGKRVIIAKAEVIKSPNPDRAAAGLLDENLNVICGRDALRIIEIKPAGGSLLQFKDFVNGQRTRPGDSFTKIK